MDDIRSLFDPYYDDEPDEFVTEECEERNHEGCAKLNFDSAQDCGCGCHRQAGK